MMSASAEVLFKLLRISLGNEKDFSLPLSVNWKEVIDLSFEQGVAAIAVDGLQRLYDANEELGVRNEECLAQLDSPSLEDLKYEWFGEVMNCEQEFATKVEVINYLLGLWRPKGLEAVALKGVAFAQYYPVPQHRYSCDFDCYVRPDWKLADDLVRKDGNEVNDSESKHSRYVVKGVSVENHRNVIGVNGSRKRKEFDAYLQGLLKDSSPLSAINSRLLTPPWLFDALFCLAHAQNHFLEEEGITLKHVLDWGMIRNEELGMRSEEFRVAVDRFGLRKFYEAMEEVADYVLGGERRALSEAARRLLEDVLAPKDVRHFGSRFMAHLNILRMVWVNRWKYRYYSQTSALATMWRYVYGHFFDRN